MIKIGFHMNMCIENEGKNCEISYFENGMLIRLVIKD
jgi:hypothetical protein